MMIMIQEQSTQRSHMDHVWSLRVILVFHFDPWAGEPQPSILAVETAGIKTIY